MNCTYCKGVGWHPYMTQTDRVYIIKWTRCIYCNRISYTDKRESERKIMPEDKLIGYIPRGHKVPTIAQVISK